MVHVGTSEVESAVIARLSRVWRELVMLDCGEAFFFATQYNIPTPHSCDWTSDALIVQGDVECHRHTVKVGTREGRDQLVLVSASCLLYSC